MAKQFPQLEPAHREFIQRQRVFFTASAAATGHVNLSPKGLDALRVLGEKSVAYLDLTGSGNETAAHLLADGRLTLMFCAFEGPPLILRLYGRGRAVRRGSAEYTRLLASDFGGVEPLGARQIIVLDIDLVQTSCGYGVPLFEYTSERPTLTKWAEAKGPEGLDTYRRKKNVRSLDGLPTGLLDEEADGSGSPTA
ncbi:pyridoxamine 5'-phosphate oxidase family protein [Archangium minus]|uniref:Pyridoxamine 5'-phosphate oxidase family protein n=1 Tax=Archangium minus TaxID=83450 RepID=A0ABY9X6S9_9BACT|nr:pyridoxamine 5'-phosphate oxidase family protein [Archangium violaceum]WNG51101.1 pyridoxamine 5'-phosphate oxidase family protein [Archangium minus]